MVKVSLIVPTYNEKENLPLLAERVFKAVGESKLDLEMLVVDDDSPDGTAKVAEDLSKKYPIKVIVRKTDKGLSPAVLEGFKHANSEIIGVMDADLSHPPEKILELVKALEKADFAVGSRRAPGGCVENWPLYRRIISAGAALLARPLVKVSDPMSGYFFLKKKLVEGKEFNPIGYKIMLEILVKTGIKNIAEVPITFKDRALGKSKIGFKVYKQYLTHLARLYAYKISS
ncbi:MAG: polyprenol monophosphomannose synthase [Candidatus Altiarchaeales archaeon]|nr:polyprenol monophosphomannose synthase [Candidatus Altiarchaeales archaeon]